MAHEHNLHSQPHHIFRCSPPPCPLLATLLAVRGVKTYAFIDLGFLVYLFFITRVWFPYGIIEVMAVKTNGIISLCSLPTLTMSQFLEHSIFVVKNCEPAFAIKNCKLAFLEIPPNSVLSVRY